MNALIKTTITLSYGYHATITLLLSHYHPLIYKKGVIVTRFDRTAEETVGGSKSRKPGASPTDCLAKKIWSRISQLFLNP